MILFQVCHDNMTDSVPEVPLATATPAPEEPKPEESAVQLESQKDEMPNNEELSAKSEERPKEIIDEAPDKSEDKPKEIMNELSAQVKEEPKEEFKLSMTNLRLLQDKDQRNGVVEGSESPKRIKLESTSGDSKDTVKVEARKSDISVRTVDPKSSDNQLHGNSLKSKEGTPSKHRDHRSDRHKHRPKRCNIGIQCRRDKDLKKEVGFSSTPKTTEGDETKFRRRFGSGVSGGFCMANPCPSLIGKKYKYGRFMRVEIYPNGGGKVLHMWQDEFDHLSDEEKEALAREFIEVRECIFYKSSKPVHSLL